MTCHVTRLTQNDVKSQNMEYMCKYSVQRVEILQGWCTARTTHCDSGYDVTIATYSLPDLYLPKRKNALFVAPESDRLSCVCSVYCPYSLTPTEWTSRAANTSWRRGNLTLPFGGRRPGAIVLPWKYHKGHAMDLCDEYNNFTKFPFYTWDVFRDIPFFVILHHFLSIFWCH